MKFYNLKAKKKFISNLHKFVSIVAVLKKKNIKTFKFKNQKKKKTVWYNTFNINI
jgi:hypothetical protein